MFDIGMSELLLIGIVALIVVGPKDLPGLFHTLGRMTAKARSLGREFSRAMNDAAKDSGVGDVANDIKGISSPKKFGLDKLNDAADRFDKWDPNAAKPATKGKPPEHHRPDPDRQADIDKIRAATEKAGQDKLDREAAEKAATEAEAVEPAQAPDAKKPAAKKPAAKKAATKKPATKKPAAKKPAATAKTPAATAKKPTPAKPATRKTNPKPAPAKPAAKPAATADKADDA